MVSDQFNIVGIMSCWDWDKIYFFAHRFYQMTWLSWRNLILVIWCKQLGRQYLCCQPLIHKSCTIGWVPSCKWSFSEWANQLHIFLFISCRWGNSTIGMMLPKGLKLYMIVLWSALIKVCSNVSHGTLYMSYVKCHLMAIHNCKSKFVCWALLLWFC